VRPVGSYCTDTSRFTVNKTLKRELKDFSVCYILRTYLIITIISPSRFRSDSEYIFPWKCFAIC